MIRRAIPAALAVTGLLLGGCSAEEYLAPPPAPVTEAADAVTAAETLSVLQDAVGAGDQSAAGELGADPQARELLAAIAANASALRLTDLSMRYLTETGRTDGADAWQGLASVTWRIRGFDETAARLELPVSFADGGRRIAAIGGRTGRLPLWLSGPLTVARVPGALVLASGAGADLTSYTRWARRAIVQARGVVGGRARLVVEVPGDAAAMHRALGADSGEYDAIAALTAPVDGSRVADSPVHVFLNPVVFGDLDQVAAQVVMTHEAVHALTGAVLAGRAPLWLVEGFADYVALRDVDLPLARTAGQILAQVRTQGVPDALPADTEFDPAGRHLGGVYEAAWQASVTIAERGGESALVGLYEEVLDGTKLAVALRSGLGWSAAELTAAWRDRLAGLAGVSQ